MICRYIVLNERSPGTLRESVESYISRGWKLEGGVSVAIGNQPGVFYVFAQAMSLEENISGGGA